MIKKLFATFGLFLLGCTGREHYSLTQVSELKTAAPSGATLGKTLRFKLKTESLYFTPGLSKKSGAGESYFVVRCKVGQSCRVDLPAKLAESGEIIEILLPPGQSAPLTLVDDSGAAMQTE